MNEPPHVVLVLTSRAENVALVREALAGLAEGVDLGDSLDDIRAAVSEAANNVVVHAYGGGEGPMELDLRVAAAQLEVTVRDYGSGTAVRADDDDNPGRGIGLAVIDALTAETITRSSPGRGTEIVMRFVIPAAVVPPPAPVGLPAALAPTAAGGTAVHLTAVPATLAGPILGRLLGALAARAAFSIDRISDAQLVSDAIGARVAPVLERGRLDATLELLDRAVALRVGPLREGGAAALLAAARIGGSRPLIEPLADSIEVGGGDDGAETLTVVLHA